MAAEAPETGSAIGVSAEGAAGGSSARPEGTDPAAGQGASSGADKARTLTSGGTPAPLRSRRSKRYSVVIGCVVAIAAIAAGVWYWHSTEGPSEASVRAHLAATLPALPAQITAIDLTFGPAGATGTTLIYRARFETTEPLYRRLDTLDYLRAHAPSDLPTIEAANTLLSGPDGARIRARLLSLNPPTPTSTAAPPLARPAASAAPGIPLPESSGSTPMSASSNPSSASEGTPPEQVRAATLLTTLTPAGTSFLITGQLLAFKREGAWVFSGEPPILDALRKAGERRPAGATVFAVDLPSDATRLATLIAEAVAFAKQVEQAAVAPSLATRPESRSGGDGQMPPTHAAPTADALAKTGDRTPATGKGEPQPPETRDPSTTQIVVRASSPVAQNGEPVTGGERASSPVVSHANQTGGDARSPSGSDHPASSTPPAENSESIRSPQSEIRNSTPSSAVRLPPSDFPSAPGAYVLADGAWVRLPANHGHNIQSTAQVVAMKFAQLNQAEDKWAGKTPTVRNDPVADLLFDGFDQVPVVPAKNVVVLFLGSLPPPPPDAVKKYPQLGTYPLLELAPETFLANGNRYALLYLIGPGFIGFGPKRVEATLETPKPDVTLLRCTAELAPGRYAFSCGAQSFEVGVK